jgi:hypothetical protein
MKFCELFFIFPDLIMMAAEESEFFEDKDDRLWLPSSAVQALEQELQMFSEWPKNLKQVWS